MVMGVGERARARAYIRFGEEKSRERKGNAMLAVVVSGLFVSVGERDREISRGRACEKVPTDRWRCSSGQRF